MLPDFVGKNRKKNIRNGVQTNPCAENIILNGTKDLRRQFCENIGFVIMIIFWSHYEQF